MNRKHTSAETVDPLAALVEQTGRLKPGAAPVPLVGSSVQLRVQGGIVAATVTRKYFNQRRRPVEALLTYPMPANAVCYRLTARIGRRRVHGVALHAELARRAYEDAIDDGRATVLHEELLPGIQMLSVGNLAPREKAEVIVQWVDSVQIDGPNARYRMPMTVGSIWGRSGLDDSDELTFGGSARQAKLLVVHDARAVSLRGASPSRRTSGTLRAKVPTNAPIDIEIEGWNRSPLVGLTPRNQAVTVEIEPLDDGAALDAAIVVDASGSMAGPAAALQPRRGTKHEAVSRALRDLGSMLRPGDRISVWDFQEDCRLVSPARDWLPERLPASGVHEAFAKLASKVRDPGGGSDIRRALWASGALGNRDVLLITDGLTHQVGPIRRRPAGGRVMAVMVGEDCLDGRVGRLAAKTGGETVHSFSGNVSLAMSRALRSLRTLGARPSIGYPFKDDLPSAARVRRGCAAVTACWGEVSPEAKHDDARSAVAAFAAGIAVQAVARENGENDRAARLALHEGIATSRTSIVLTDEDLRVHGSPPEFQKVRLPRPRGPSGDILANRSILRHESREAPETNTVEPFGSIAYPDDQADVLRKRRIAPRVPVPTPARAAPAGGMLRWIKASLRRLGQLVLRILRIR